MRRDVVAEREKRDTLTRSSIPVRETGLQISDRLQKHSFLILELGIYDLSQLLRQRNYLK